MNQAYEKIGKILKVEPAKIEEVDKKMSDLTGQHGVLEEIVRQNDVIVDRTLSQLGLSRSSSAEDIHSALMNRLMKIDEDLNELIGKPDLSKMSEDTGKFGQTALRVFTPPKGLFIKKDRVIGLLEKYPPDGMMSHFGYSTVKELVEKEGFASVVSALRFTQSKEWMHKFFDEAYSQLKADDFEEREVQIKVLETKWLSVAEKFLQKKFHNISHLKEFGIIFVIPLQIDTPGETLRMFTLIMHYLHEVPFYSGLFRRCIHDSDFTDKFKSLLRGDVPTGHAPDEAGHVIWRIVQQYLAKDDEGDFRLHEAHVNPEADHWLRAEEDLGRLSRMLKGSGEPMNLGYWAGMDFAGDVFKNKEGQEVLVSFDLVDLIMSLVKKGEIKYLYHQQESLWNKIFVEYMGREKLRQLIEDNIIGGFIKL